MNRRIPLAVGAATGGVLAMVVVAGTANPQVESPGAGSGEPLPAGPHVDFCPTLEQAEAHLAQYGFDYKPTVACGSEGEVSVPPGSGVGANSPADLPDPDAWEREKAFLESVRPAPDADNDPRTIEGIAPDGAPVTILIQTSDPELFKGMTPAEFAERVYR